MFLQNNFLLKADFSFCWNHDENTLIFRFGTLGSNSQGPLHSPAFLPLLTQIPPTLLPSQHMDAPQHEKRKIKE